MVFKNWCCSNIKNSNRKIYSSISDTTEINDKCEHKNISIYIYIRRRLQYQLNQKGFVDEANKKRISSISNWKIIIMLVFWG